MQYLCCHILYCTVVLSFPLSLSLSHTHTHTSQNVVASAQTSPFTVQFIGDGACSVADPCMSSSS